MFISCCYNTSVGASPPQVWQNELCVCLKKLATGKIGIDADKALDGALELQASVIESEIAIPAIFEMWFRNVQNIELFWWKQESRATRCFVMALYLCATDEPVSWVPNFDRYIIRFNRKEQEEREEEQEFIIEHRSGLAGLIAQILKKRDIERYNSDFKDYFGAMERRKIGKSLPKWCDEENSKK
jgi:hypothetical protein